MSCVYPSILGFYTQRIPTGLFKVQCTVGCNVASIWIKNEEEPGTCWGIKEGIGDFCINTLVLVSGQDSQHRGSPGHVLLEANPVCVLAKHWSIVIGIGNLYPDLGSAA
uniref:Uncharacterized protein n=1 Tax=Sus scrofa TaxID=9823 RepID=A0A8D2CDW2_PIG